MPGSALDAALRAAGDEAAALPHLAHNASADVGVVNVALPAGLVAQHVRSGARVLPVQGFGYLLPSGTPNAAGVLGVVFDSDSLPTQDAAAPTAEAAAAAPTKLTVMLGGPHWKGRAPLPDAPQLRRLALDALHAHLGLPRALLDDPATLVVARLQRACIPHYAVGHLGRMRELHAALSSASSPWRGRLALVGASWTGVSLNDCVLGARRTARRIIDEEQQGEAGAAHWHATTTGLERFAPSHEAHERAAVGQHEGALGGGILGNAA
jgi:oxygen-dependent protoporphyrinogen oxidase